MTCHHRSPMMHEGVRYAPDQVIGDAKRCRCAFRLSGLDHCHHTADGEDMICVFCRTICKVEAGKKFKIMPEIGVAAAQCRCCLDNLAARGELRESG